MFFLLDKHRNMRFFFDLDLWGSNTETDQVDEVHALAWEDDEKILIKAIVSSILEVYPQFQMGLELVAFCSSGMSPTYERYKASYHLVFPQIIVDRPVKCWPAGGVQCKGEDPARHIAVRNHIVCRLTEQSAVEESPLSVLRHHLIQACSNQTISGESELDAEDPTFLNDWTEVLDENPLWHEPWPEAASGTRLPFTDKPHEGRPKRPLGRWRFVADEHGGQTSLRMSPLPALDAISLMRLGDISVCGSELTRWNRDAILDDVWAECYCPSCHNSTQDTLG